MNPAVAQLQQGTENGPTVGYRIAWWLGHLLGFGVNVLQSLRAEVSRSQLLSGGHRRTNRLARFSPERTRGERNVATFQKKRFELKGVTQLYSTNQNMWKCFIFKLLTVRTVFIKMWLEDCQTDVHEEILIMQCFSLAWEASVCDFWPGAGWLYVWLGTNACHSAPWQATGSEGWFVLAAQAQWVIKA